MSVRFDGRVAIVTGAGAGLGRSHALLLAERGARVVVNDPGGSVDGSGGSQAAADKVVAEIKAKGGEAVANYASVSDPVAAATIAKTAIDTWGRIDILINNAGILRDKSFAKMDLPDFEQVVDVHFMGSVYVTKAVWPHMLERGYGRIVMTTSAAGLFGNFGQTNYGGAKAALIGFMNALKQEGAKYGIQVNTIAPVARTRMTESLLPPSVIGYLDPEFISQAVVYLCWENTKANGDIISAGAGYYGKIQFMESPGVGFDPAKPVTLEMVAENYGKISNMTGAKGYGSAMEELSHVFEHLAKK